MSDFDHFVGTGAVSEKNVLMSCPHSVAGREPDGFTGPLTVEMFKGGQSNPTYKLITPAKAM